MAKQKSCKQLLGQAAEEAACELLKQNGLQILETNYTCKQGEIDIIAQDGDCRVFVEVRFREKPKHGSSIESITPQKLHNVIQSIQHYLLSNKLYGEIMYRVDVIGFESNLNKPVWLKNITI